MVWSGARELTEQGMLLELGGVTLLEAASDYLREPADVVALESDLRAVLQLQMSMPSAVLVTRGRLMSRALDLARGTCGDEQYLHQIRVSHLASQLEVDAATFGAVMVHDVPISIGMVSEVLGLETAEMVAGASRLGAHELWPGKGNEPKVPGGDRRAALVHLVHRLSLYRDINAAGEWTRVARRRSRHDRDLARAIGLSLIEWELDDLIFRLGTGVREAEQALLRLRESHAETVQAYGSALTRRLAGAGMQPDMIARMPHLAAVGRTQTVTLRVILPKVADCMSALRIIDLMAGATPAIGDRYTFHSERNLYKALRSSAQFEGAELDVQIRTREMESIGQLGLAAYHRLVRACQPQDPVPSVWFRQLYEWRLEQDVDERPQPWIITPKGDSRLLKDGASLLDAAYAIDSKTMGPACIGGRVDGVEVGLGFRIRPGGCTVEIFTADVTGEQAVTLWTNAELEVRRALCVSAKARRAILNVLKERVRQKGRDRLDELIRRVRADGLSKLTREETSRIFQGSDEKSFCEALGRVEEPDAMLDRILDLISVLADDGMTLPWRVPPDEIRVAARGPRAGGPSEIPVTEPVAEACDICLPSPEAGRIVAREPGGSAAYNYHRPSCHVLSTESQTEVDWDLSNVRWHRLTIGVTSAAPRHGFVADVLSAGRRALIDSFEAGDEDAPGTRLFHGRVMSKTHLISALRALETVSGVIHAGRRVPRRIGGEVF